MGTRTRQKPVWIRIAGGAFYGLILFAALGVGAGYRWIGKSSLLVEMVKSHFGIAPTPPKEIFGSDSVTLLVLGCDEDKVWGKGVIREKARSDMMLVAKVDFVRKRITGVSIPRDTLVAVPGYAEQKINGYHAIGLRNGGEEMAKLLAKEAAQTCIGVPIDRVLVLDYKAMQEMVNLVGGVDIFVDKHLKYDDNWGNLHIDLKPGKHRLNGYEAMGFVRFRHDRGSDFARQDRQKQFLLAFKESLQQSMGRLPEVINKAVEAMSGGLSENEVNCLAMFAQKVGGDNIRLGQIPVVDAPNYNLRVDQRRLPGVLAEFHLIESPVATTTRLSYRR